MNNRAFTLLDALMGLLVMSVLIILIVQMMELVKDNYYENPNQRQVTLFLMQVQDDLIETKGIKTENNTFSLTLYNKDVVTYSQEKNQLVRKVNDEGYEVVLNQIKEIKFWLENDIVYFSLIDENEQKIKGVVGNEIRL